MPPPLTTAAWDGTPARPPRVARNIIDLVVNRFSVPLASLLLLVVVARQSSDLLGWYVVANVYFFALQTLPFLGLTPWIMREAARRPADRPTIYGSTVALAIGATAVLVAGLPLVLSFNGYPAEVNAAIWIAGVTAVPYSAAYAAELLFVSAHETTIISLTPALEGVLRVAASLVALEYGYGLEALFWIAFAGRVVTAAIYWVVLRRRVFHGAAVRCSLRLVGQMLRLSPVFLVNTAVLFAIQRAAFIILSWYVSAEAIADFAVAYRPVEIAVIAITAFVGAIYPRLSAADGLAGVDTFRTLSSRMTRLMVVAAAVAAVMGIALSGAFVSLLFPMQAAAVPLLRVMMAALVFIGLRVVTSSVLMAAGRPGADAATLGVGAVVQIALLLWLVPRYGTPGAAAAVLGESIVQLIVRATVLDSHYERGGLVRLALLTLTVVSAAAAAAVWASPAIAAAAGILLASGYLVAVVRSGAVGKDDLALLTAQRASPAAAPEATPA